MKHLPYVQDLRDRHGHQRYYFRRPGFARMTLPGSPGSPEFVAAYRAAVDGGAAPVERPLVGEARSPSGSVSRAIAGYYRHNSFAQELAQETQKSRRNILEGFRREYGDMPIAKLKRSHIELLIGEKTPNMQRNWLKTLRGLMKFAVAVGLVGGDPTADIRRAKVAKTDGWYTWTEADITKFQAHWPVGSTPRLAMALMLYTLGAAQRRDCLGSAACEGRADRDQAEEDRAHHRAAALDPDPAAVGRGAGGGPGADGHGRAFDLSRHFLRQTIQRGRIRQSGPRMVRRRWAAGMHRAWIAQGMLRAARRGRLLRIRNPGDHRAFGARRNQDLCTCRAAGKVG
jgi:hypothetical protein